MLVFGGVQVISEFVGCLPQYGFKTERRSVSILL